MRVSSGRALYVYSLVMGTGMVIGLLLFTGVFGSATTLPGLRQRVVIVFISLWVGGVSLHLFRRHRLVQEPNPRIR